MVRATSPAGFALQRSAFEIAYDNFRHRDTARLAQATAGVPGAAVTPPPGIADICDASPEARLRHTYGRAYRDLVRGFACDFSAAPDLLNAPTHG